MKKHSSEGHRLRRRRAEQPRMTKFESRVAAIGAHEKILSLPSWFSMADDPGDGRKTPAQSAFDAVDQIVHRAYR